PAAGRRAAGPLPRFAPLPGTAAEAEAVRPALAAYLGGEPQALLGTEATESAVKGIARPRALVLATHGFALPAPERDIPADSVFAARGLTPFGAERPKPHSPKPSASVISVVRYAGPAIENPLLRCGVALAGANTRIEEGGPAEDGILTGLEVAGLDLRGTELVVLSACQTGLGDVRTGEGVADLRHAFRLAGARAVVASLWEVPDAETADLMARFWEELAAGEEPAAALRAAQLGLLEDLREQGDARPALWAAFSVTGRAGAGDAVATTADDHETDEDPTPN
ncbi:MAG TPA: CHAT domain-containing protein, partial [Planctomycetaceae bacterium]